MMKDPFDWDEMPRPDVTPEHLAMYTDRYLEKSDNGYQMLYSLDELATGTKYYELWVSNPEGKLVAYSRSEVIDLNTEREFHLDYMIDDI